MLALSACRTVRDAPPRMATSPALRMAAPPPLREASVVVTIDHNDATKATSAFRFAHVPTPRPNAAEAATFELIDGETDPRSSSLDALHDRELPQLPDEPDANFFFRNGSDGGRLRVDLGHAIAIAEIDSFSWHPGERAPQVYRVWGSDGSSNDFTARPRRPLEPAAHGWQLLASVDTHARFADAGGQYGVTVTRPDATLGHFRYLLFDVSRSAPGVFGNSFFSELVVVDRDTPASAYAVAGPRKQQWTYDRGGFRVTFVNEEPAIGFDVVTRLVETFYAVYPLMWTELNDDAPKDVRIIIDRHYAGVAMTSGATIHLGAKFYRQHPDALDVVTHEAMHIVQSLGSGAPAWLIEGIADWGRNRYGVDNHDWSMPPYAPGQSYRDSYRITARFLTWLDKHEKRGVVLALDRWLRRKAYSDDVWVELTGKRADELWQRYAQRPAL